MNIVSWLSNLLADWYWALQGVSLVLIAGTVVIGGLTILAGREASFRQEKKLIDAQRELEKERLNRLELEKAIAPRDLRLFESGGKSNIDSLKPFAGTEVILWYFPDAEPERAARNIDGLTQKAGWKIDPEPSGEKRGLGHTFFDCVVVEPHTSPGAGDTNAAADALVGFLRANNWVANKWTGEAITVPPNTVRINIGVNPNRYFWTEEMKNNWNLRLTTRPPKR